MRRTALMLLAVTLIPLPALAADGSSQPVTKVPASRITLKQAVAHAAAETPLVATLDKRTNQQAGADKHSSGFFRTPAGIAALAVMAVGTGYAVYSAKHDRITSPAKK
jgi:hypothetical protein